jgi:hypothetical protein
VFDAEPDAVLPKVTSVVTVAEAMTVRSQGDYEVAAKHLGIIKALQKTVSEQLDPIVEKAHSAWKATIALRKDHLDPLLGAERTVKARMGEHAERVEAAKQKALAEARVIEEARLRAHAEAEAAALAEADALADVGEVEEAERIVEALPPPPEPEAVFYHAAPKVQGISSTTVWKAEVVDFRALVEAVAAGFVPITALEPSAAGLRAYAKSQQRAGEKHGVRIHSEQVITQRSIR